MITQERIQQLINASPNDCQQIVLNVNNKPAPQKERRTYTTQIQNMIKEETWYLLGNANWNPPIADLAKRYDIDQSSLKYYRQKLKENINWMPNLQRGEKQRLFTKEEEKAVIDNLINKARAGIPITNEIARQSFLAEMNKIIDEPNRLEEFKSRNFRASDKFIRALYKRHDVSRRRAHLKRRSVALDLLHREIANFRNSVLTYLQSNPIKPENVLNADETFWRQVEFARTTIAYKGDDNIHIYTDVNEKAGTTVLATIDSCGGILPLLIIAKGTSNRCEYSQLGFSNPVGQANPNPFTNTIHYTTHSPKGWMNEDIWLTYLNQLRQLRPYDPQFPQDSLQNQIVLLYDAFGAHSTTKAMELAGRLNIQVFHIPAGCTDECQPLDRRIFGSMKQKACAYISRQIANLPGINESNAQMPQYRPSKKDSIELLIRTWEELSINQITNAWNLALHGRENAPNDDV